MTMGKRKAKTAVQTVWEGASSVAVSQADDKILKLEEKVDQLMATVATMSEKIQNKHSPLELSPVPAAHSSLCEETDSRKLPSFHELKSDAVVQSEVAKRMHHHDHVARGDVLKGRV